ncbi:phage integrase N-terminal SAM-like domain-containing protein [Chloroflexota bacterium]
MRDAFPLKHYACRTEKTYVYWAKRYVLYHNICHPRNWVDVLISDIATGVR